VSLTQTKNEKKCLNRIIALSGLPHLFFAFEFCFISSIPCNKGSVSMLCKTLGFLINFYWGANNQNMLDYILKIELIKAVQYFKYLN
jgi:hypothetical protein